MKIKLLGLCFTVTTLLLSGCSNNAGTGALVGSLVGAGIGKSTVNHTDERAAVGAVIGGMVGAVVGSEKDRNTVSRSSSHTAYVQQTTSTYQPQYVYVDRPYYVRPARVTISSSHYGRRPYYRPHYRPHRGHHNRYPTRWRPNRGHGYPHRYR